MEIVIDSLAMASFAGLMVLGILVIGGGIYEILSTIIGGRR